MFGIGQRKITLRPTTTVPGASGEAEIGRDKNGNTTVRLQVWHLAPPANLTPAAGFFIVWAQAGAAPAENKGVLKVNDNLQGEMRFLTAAREFDLYITAEVTPSPAAPSPQPVLAGHLPAKAA